MYLHYSFPATAWILVIIKLNALQVVTEIVSYLLGDLRNWYETGKNANLAKFNSLYPMIIEEEALNIRRFCTGKCDSLDRFGAIFGGLVKESQTRCRGELIRCWFYKETPRHKDAAQKLTQAETNRWIPTNDYHVITILLQELEEAQYKFDHAGNTCKCLCERMDDLDDEHRGSLLDSYCLDPVSVDEKHVVTGVRFRRHGAVIHLELQQARLSNGRIVSMPEWITSNHCNESTLVDSYSRLKNNKRFSIIAEDLVLSEDAVVTGVTPGKALKGRHLTQNGNFDGRRSEFTKATQCSDEMSRNSFLRDANAEDEHPRLSTGVSYNYERSESCRTRILFWETSAEVDDMQHVVPFIDLQEVVTNPPEAIHGVGWYLRGYPGYGGFLALKIFKQR